MSKKLLGVTTRQPLKGNVDVLPRMVIQAQGDSSFAVARVDASKIISFLIAPVIEVNKKYKLTQETRDGWDRILKEVDFSEIARGVKPLVVSARKNWNLYESEINIIEAAYIIDGAKYLEYLCRYASEKYISMIVLFNKTETEELIIRRQIGDDNTFSIHDIKNKVGTNAPRMTIGESWQQVKILSDPFVIKTGLGYTAAINVVDLKTNTIHHIIIGAKSISNDLEKIRNEFGTLSNIQLKIRKQSADPKSLYEIRI